MALFESYERRIDQINAALAKFDIKSIEEAKAICDEKGIDVYEIVKSTQPICFENACKSKRNGLHWIKLKWVRIRIFSLQRGICNGAGHQAARGI